MTCVVDKPATIYLAPGASAPSTPASESAVAAPIYPRVWSCVIPGKPTPKGNSKSVVRMGKRLVPVASSKVRGFESSSKAIAYTQRPAELLVGAVVVDVDFVFAIPKSRSKGKRMLRVGDPHTSRPDRGNLLKMLEDVLEGVAYADDAAVFDGRVRKVWGERDETRVTVRAVEGGAV